jgi:ferredoxin
MSLVLKEIFLMPLIHFAGETVSCSRSDNLRSVLMRHTPAMKGKLYNSVSGLTHCRGLGTCGTCAVEVQGEVTPMTKIEKWRLGFPPHHLDAGLRLACQVCVLGDLVVTKHSGMWGQRFGE